MNLEKHFTTTYKDNSWCDTETRSGPGSNRNSDFVKETINFVINCINLFYKERDTISIADIPCGDFNFIDLLLKEILLNTNCKQINYYAYDIVPDIESDFNNKLIRIENVEYNFQVLDATKEIINSSDIILCKELFIHLSFEHIIQVTENFKKSNSSYLICNDFEGYENKDITYNCPGECRIVCLTKPPFNMSIPLFSENNYKIWNLKNI